jgi:HlyD family secretion protein
LIAGALGIALAIVLALLPKSIAVDTATVTRGPLEVEIREDGQTRVRDRYVIAAPISGELERVPVEAGTWVERDALVARIEPPHSQLLDERTRGETTARLAAARARERQAVTAIVRAGKSKELAIREADRTRTLVAQRAITGAEHERAELSATLAIEELAAAEQQRAIAAAEIEALRAVLEPRDARSKRFDIVAPTRGRVLRVFRESAGPIAAGAPIVEIGDPASLEVVIDVLSRDAERITPGMDVYIETSGEQPVRGTVSLVEPSAFTRVSALGVEEQRVNVIVCFEGPATIGDAFRVDARIVTWHGNNVPRVPASALFRDRGRWAVYILAGGRARLRSVDIGHRGRVDVEVVSGLSDNERVLVHPSDQIRDGTRVKARD